MSAMTLPDGYMWRSQAAKYLGITGGAIRSLIEAGRLSLDEVADSEGNTIHAIRQDSLDALKDADDLGPGRPEWRDTHMGIRAAAQHLGVPFEAIRGLVNAQRVPVDEVLDSKGKPMKMLSRETVATLQEQMRKQG